MTGITDAIISYWSAVGLKVKNDQQESGVWLDNLIKLNWDGDLQTNGVLTGVQRVTGGFGGPQAPSRAFNRRPTPLVCDTSLGRPGSKTSAAQSGRGADWIARLLGVQEVAGSNPVAPT